MGPSLTLMNGAGGAGAGASIDFDGYDPGNVNPPAARIRSIDDGNYSSHIAFLAKTPGAAINGLVENLRINSNGNVGVGTSTPASKLHVIGDITVCGDILLTGADCAGHFDAADSLLPDAGTVVVIDESGRMRESNTAYDKKVAGIVSGAGEYRHALVLDKRPSDKGRIPVALVGKVYCKVDAQYSPIEVGDLLTTSPTAGHAMKALNARQAFGAIISKALRAFQGHQGLIPILVALQ